MTSASASTFDTSLDRSFWHDVFSLYGVQAFAYAIPLFTLPYLSRVLGPAEWGALAFAEAFANYVSLVVEYGFGLSATREVSQSRFDPLARGSKLASVIGAQSLLALLAVVLAPLIARALPSFATSGRLIPCALVLAVGRAVFPIWYFRGIERVRIAAALNVGANAAAAGAIFFLVRSPNDGWISLAVRGAAASVSSLIAFRMAFRDTPLIAPSLAGSIACLREGASLFLFAAAITLFTSMNVILLGFMSTPMIVGWFAGAEKITRAALTAFSPLTQMFYARVSHLIGKDRGLAAKVSRRSALITGSLGCALGFALAAGAPLIVRLLLGKSYLSSIPVLRILALLCPLIAGSNALGVQWMLPLRRDREYNTIVIVGGVLNVVLGIVLAKRYGPTGMAVSVVTAEAFVTLSIISVLRRNHLDPWSVRACP